MPPTKASNAAAQQPPTQQQGGRTPGTAFFAKGGGAEQPSSQPPLTQTLKMQQAAARNRAQRPSGKTNDAKPVFKVLPVFDDALSLSGCMPGSTPACQAASTCLPPDCCILALQCSSLPCHVSSACSL